MCQKNAAGLTPVFFVCKRRNLPVIIFMHFFCIIFLIKTENGSNCRKNEQDQDYSGDKIPEKYCGKMRIKV